MLCIYVCKYVMYVCHVCVHDISVRNVRMCVCMLYLCMYVTLYVYVLLRMHAMLCVYVWFDLYVCVAMYEMLGYVCMFLC